MVNLGKKAKDLKEKIDISKEAKKNAKELKKQEKAQKSNTKATEKGTKASQKNTKAEQQEAQANQQSTLSEQQEATTNIAGAVAEESEAVANTTSTTAEITESSANTIAAAAEGTEAAANVVSTTTEVAEGGASGASAAADTTEASTSIAAAAADATESVGNTAAALTGAAESAAQIPFAGWAIALGILALAGVAGAAALAVANVNGAFDNEYGAQKKADNINKLSGEIYELTERARALDDITNSFQDIDDKVIKTKKDIEEMNSLLEQAGDELSDEIEEDEDIGYGKGVSAKEAYAALSREEDKVAFLEAEAKRNRKLANEKRQEQLDTFNNARREEKKLLLYGKDAQYVTARSAIYGINNNSLYERIDALKDLPDADKEALESTEALAQSMLNELDITRALEIANEDSDQTIRSLIDTLSGLKDGAVVESFMNEDTSFKDRVMAFRELTNELQGNQEMLTALKEAYSE